MVNEDRKPSGGKPTSITIHGEFQRSVVVTPTPELDDLLNHAALINHQSSAKFHYSFGALLVAFSYGPQRISEWFKTYIATSGADLTAIISSLKLQGREEDIRRLAGQTADPTKLYSDGRRTATASSLDWIEQAKTFSDEQKHAWVGLRHLMGALIFNPTFH